MDSQIPTTKIFNFDVYEFNFKKKLDSDDFLPLIIQKKINYTSKKLRY
jgi:hypothetical protein